MSLITRCPACKTLFKVVPDQLRISEGWVRCGQCDEIFDASSHLQGGGAEAEPPPPIDPNGIAAVDLELAGDLHLSPAMLQEAVSSKPGLSAESASEPIEPVLGEFQATANEAWSAQHQSNGPELNDDASSVEPAHELSFMRNSKAPSRWHRPLVRASLVLASLLLCLGMALQLLVQERDRIAAVEPGMKPLLEEVCDFMQCTLAPLKQIESVVIDSSSFNKIRGDVYRLNFTLKNTAVTELALPAVELSLTDANDQVLMRRVFRAGELGIKSGVLVASSESSASLTLGIKINANGGPDRVAGYRILAFYP
jgi:predicted Zn finger-like uncharacterized protein